MKVRSLDVFRYLKAKPFESITSDGRESERYRMAAWAVVANVFSKAAALALLVCSVSLTLPYLGAQRFGIWMTIASFSGMLTFLGMGVGNALTNVVASRSAERPKEAHSVISGGLGLLAIVGLVAAISLYHLVDFLPWNLVIKSAEPELLLQTQQAAKIFALLFGLNLFTTGIQSVFAGLQRTFEVHLVNVIGSLLAVMCLWIASERQAGLVVLLLATFGVQTSVTLGLLALLVRRQLFTIAKLPMAIQSESRGLLRSGSLFFVLQIGTMVGWGSDALIISSTLGPASVAVYSVVTRLFQFVSHPLAMINAPLWGAYADAHSKGDLTFIKKTLKTSLLLTFIMATVAGFLLYLLGPWLLTLWTRELIVAPTYLLVAVAVWTVLDCCGGALGMFLNGMNIVKQQVMVVSIFCLLVLPLKIFGAIEIGLIAIPVAAILTYALTHGLLYGVVFLPHIRSTMDAGRSS